MWYNKYNWVKLDRELYQIENNLSVLPEDVLEGTLKDTRFSNLPLTLDFYTWNKEVEKSRQWERHNQSFECNCDDCLAEGNHGEPVPFELMYVLRFPSVRLGLSKAEWIDNFLRLSGLGPIQGLNSRWSSKPYIAAQNPTAPLAQSFFSIVNRGSFSSCLNYPNGFLESLYSFDVRDYGAESLHRLPFVSLNSPTGFYSYWPKVVRWKEGDWEEYEFFKGEEKYAESFWGDAGSGVLVVARDTQRILLGLRSEDVNEPNTWGNFGGAIGVTDEGEPEEALPPDENALKEMAEEIGYTGAIEMIPSFTYRSPEFTYYNFIGVVEREDDISLDNFNWEISELRWFTVEEVKALSNLHFGVSELMRQETLVNRGAEQILELPTTQEGLSTLMAKLIPALNLPKHDDRRTMEIIEQMEDLNSRVRNLLPIHQNFTLMQERDIRSGYAWFFEPGLFLEFGPFFNHEDEHQRLLMNNLEPSLGTFTEQLANPKLLDGWGKQTTVGVDLISIPPDFNANHWMGDFPCYYYGARLRRKYDNAEQVQGQKGELFINEIGERLDENEQWGARYYKLTLETLNALIQNKNISLNFPKGGLI